MALLRIQLCLDVLLEKLILEYEQEVTCLFKEERLRRRVLDFGSFRPGPSRMLKCGDEQPVAGAWVGCMHACLAEKCASEGPVSCSAFLHGPLQKGMQTVVLGSSLLILTIFPLQVLFLALN